MASVPYDQREGFIWMDGALLPWRDAKTHVLTHALHYASAVFEGMRAYDGEIFKLTEHSQRLHESAKILDFEIPYAVAEIDKACREAVQVNKLVDAYVRPIAWRGSEQMGVAAQATTVHLAIAAWDWGSYTEGLWELVDWPAKFAVFAGIAVLALRLAVDAVLSVIANAKGTAMASRSEEDRVLDPEF